MRDGFYIVVIIPALNESETIGKVIDALPRWVDRILVADNGSSDGTAKIAIAHGAEVVHEPKRGYGAACFRATKEVSTRNAPDERIIVVFLDGDFSDNPDELGVLVDPIAKGGYHFVLGSRVDGIRERGALSLPQRFGSVLASFLLKVLYDANFRDLGPFRAIRWDKLEAMRMDDLGFGWTVQMQARSARLGLQTLEVPVSYRNRAGGASKVSGTIRGVFGASATILKVIFQEAFDGTGVGTIRVPSSPWNLARRMKQWLRTCQDSRFTTH